MSFINNTPGRWPGPGRSPKNKLRKYVAFRSAASSSYFSTSVLFDRHFGFFGGSVDVLTKIQVTLTSSSKLPSLMFTDVDFDDSGSIEVDRIFSQCSSCKTLELAS